jgi:hypothetical protein
MSSEEQLSLANCYYRVAADMEAQGRWYLETASRLNFLADSICERNAVRQGGESATDQQSSTVDAPLEGK